MKSASVQTKVAIFLKSGTSPILRHYGGGTGFFRLKPKFFGLYVALNLVLPDLVSHLNPVLPDLVSGVQI